MRLSTSSVFTEVPVGTLKLPVEVANLTVDTVLRLEVVVPAAIGVQHGFALKDLPTGSYNSSGVWVPYTIGQYKFLGIFSTDKKFYDVSIDGTASVSKSSSIKLFSGTDTTGKIIFDSPIVITNSVDSSVTFADFFGTNVPTRVEIYNALPASAVVEILIGLGA